jgi:hypothetical protein
MVVRRLVAAEIVWGGHGGAVDLAREHFAVPDDGTPEFGREELASFDRSRLDPARADAALGLWSPGRREEYLTAAAEIAMRHGLMPVKVSERKPVHERRVRLIAAEIARSYRGGRVDLKAAGEFAGRLASEPKLEDPKPATTDETGTAETATAAETRTTEHPAAETASTTGAHAGDTSPASGAPSEEGSQPPSEDVRAARARLRELSEDRFATVAEDARKMVADIAGVVPSIRVTDEPLSFADELGLLAAAEISGYGLDAAVDLVRDVSTRRALETIESVPPVSSTQAWFDAGRMLRDAGAVPRTRDLDGPAAYLDHVFRPRLLVTAARLSLGHEAARRVARTIDPSAEYAGRPGGAVPTTMRLLDTALRRAGISLRSLGEWPSLPPELLSHVDDIVSGLKPDTVTGDASDAIRLLVAEAIYDSGSYQAGIDLARALAGPPPAPASEAGQITPGDDGPPPAPLGPETPVSGTRPPVTPTAEPSGGGSPEASESPGEPVDAVRDDVSGAEPAEALRGTGGPARSGTEIPGEGIDQAVATEEASSGNGAFTTTPPSGGADPTTGRGVGVPPAFFGGPRPRVPEGGQGSPTPPGTRPRTRKEPESTPEIPQTAQTDGTAVDQAYRPNTVTDDHGVRWQYASESDGEFCVNVAVVWRKQR